MDIKGDCVKCRGRLALRAKLADRAEPADNADDKRPTATTRKRVPEIYCVVCETPQEDHPALKSEGVLAEFRPAPTPTRQVVAPIDYPATIPDRVAMLEQQMRQLVADRRREAGRKAS